MSGPPYRPCGENSARHTGQSVSSNSPPRSERIASHRPLSYRQVMNDSGMSITQYDADSRHVSSANWYKSAGFSIPRPFSSNGNGRPRRLAELRARYGGFVTMRSYGEDGIERSVFAFPISIPSARSSSCGAISYADQSILLSSSPRIRRWATSPSLPAYGSHADMRAFPIFEYTPSSHSANTGM